jgi:hypothetical protein
VDRGDASCTLWNQEVRLSLMGGGREGGGGGLISFLVRYCSYCSYERDSYSCTMHMRVSRLPLAWLKGSAAAVTAFSFDY